MWGPERLRLVKEKLRVIEKSSLRSSRVQYFFFTNCHLNVRPWRFDVQIPSPLYYHVLITLFLWSAAIITGQADMIWPDFLDSD